MWRVMIFLPRSSRRKKQFWCRCYSKAASLHIGLYSLDMNNLDSKTAVNGYASMTCASSRSFFFCRALCLLF